MTRTNARLVRLAGVVLAGAIVLAGCSGETESSETESVESESTAAASDSARDPSAHNNADVTFVQGMLPHHQGAITMAALADGRAADSRVSALAARIQAAQEPEIETMTGWLDAWGEPLPGGMSEGSGMEHGSEGTDHSSDAMAMGGMSEEDMASLESASGPEFDRLFLELMIEHHEGAVDMAEKEIADGSNTDAVALAEDIAESQTEEIAEMAQLLTEVNG